MIKGIGCDIVEKKRLLNNYEKIALKILSKKELELFNSKKGDNKISFLAGRFAGKEALIKALSPNIKNLKWQDIEILNDDFGKPYINFSNTFISISHERDYAIAYVIIDN